jgi:hypothetical protein
MTVTKLDLLKHEIDVGLQDFREGLSSTRSAKDIARGILSANSVALDCKENPNGGGRPGQGSLSTTLSAAELDKDPFRSHLRHA